MRSQKVGLFEVSRTVAMFECKEAVGLPGKTCGCEIVWRAGVIEGPEDASLGAAGLARITAPSPAWPERYL